MIAATAQVATGAKVADSARIWELAHVRERARIGENVIVGRGAYVGIGVSVGRNSKIQNDALVYEPALVEDGVFIGPGVVLTNDRFPRAVNPDGSQKSAVDWNPAGVIVRQGASIGARSVCVAPVTIGRWATIAAGSVVVADVPDFALVAGVPARWKGWVGRAGVPLVASTDKAGELVCPVTGAIYVLRPDGVLTEEPS